MPRERTLEAEWWFEAVYQAIQEVPPGKVTSYGHIAMLLGEPKRSRQVGVCLKHLPRHNEGEHKYHDANVPWQRVINSKGQISPRGPGSAQRQATALRRERVEVTRNAMGEHCIDFSVYGWFPNFLPSQQEGEGEDEDEEDGGDAVDAESSAQTETAGQSSDDGRDQNATGASTEESRSGAARRNRRGSGGCNTEPSG